MALFPLPNKISQESTRTFEQKSITSNYGDGVSQRAAVGLNSRYDTWNIQLNLLTKAERDALVAFFNTHGLVKSFEWTAPETTVPTKWVFTSGMTESNVGIHYNFSFSLSQVFE